MIFPLKAHFISLALWNVFWQQSEKKQQLTISGFSTLHLLAKYSLIGFFSVLLLRKKNSHFWWIVIKNWNTSTLNSAQQQQEENDRKCEELVCKVSLKVL